MICTRTVLESLLTLAKNRAELVTTFQKLCPLMVSALSTTLPLAMAKATLSFRTQIITVISFRTWTGVLTQWWIQSQRTRTTRPTKQGFTDLRETAKRVLKTWTTSSNDWILRACNRMKGGNNWILNKMLIGLHWLLEWELPTNLFQVGISSTTHLTKLPQDCLP